MSETDPEQNFPVVVPVLVALGANLGDTKATIAQAIQALGALADGRFVTSSLWKSTPVGCPPGSPDFVNACVLIEWFPKVTPTCAEAMRWLHELQTIERQLGGERSGIANAPRHLDLDLLAVGSVICAQEDLTLPHPRALQRSFVMYPLAEIVPDFIWTNGDAVHVLAARLPAQGISRMVSAKL